MLVVKGDFEKVKAEMKEASKANTDKIKSLKKDQKARVKAKIAPSTKVAREINSLEAFQEMYKVSKVLPVRLRGQVINYKAYEALTKKLKNKPLTQILKQGFRVEYQTGPDSKGWIEFADLSQYFKGFKHIPEAEVE